MLQQVLKLSLLRLGHVERLLELALIAERAEGLLPVLLNGLVQLTLRVVELARFLSHLAHGIGKFIGGLFLIVLLDFIKVPAGARAGVGGLRKLLLLKVAGGLLHLLAGLLELLARLGKLIVLAAIHPLLNLVEVVDEVALLVLKPLEFALDTLALGLVPGVEQGNLQFLQALVQIRLPPREFLEAVERLQLLSALALLLGLLSLPLGLALQLVIVLRVLHVELIKLALGAVAVAATLLLLALLLGLLAGNAKLILAQSLQML